MKRKLLLTSCLLTMTGFLSGQNFGAVGTQWYYNHTGSFPPNSAYQHYQSVMDTLINGELTHKITRTFYQPNGTIVTAKPHYVFESSDTVFIYNFEKGRFLKLYIFNASQGDTLILDILETFPWPYDTTYKLIIDSVKILMINGIAIKKYRATVLIDGIVYFKMTNHFMDRMGWQNQFFPEYVASTPPTGSLRCYSDSQIDTNFQSVSCDFREHVSIGEIKNEFKVNVFPNPVHDRLYFSNMDNMGYEIFNSFGQKVSHGLAYVKIDVSELKSGMYMINLVVDSHIYKVKFIKN